MNCYALTANLALLFQFVTDSNATQDLDALWLPAGVQKKIVRSIFLE